MDENLKVLSYVHCLSKIKIRHNEELPFVCMYY